MGARGTRFDDWPAMSARTPATIRLEAMSETDFEDSLKRGIPMLAAELVRCGLATEELSLEASRAEFSDLLPQGLKTPGHHFRNIFDEGIGSRVGETWFTVKERDGKIHFWIDWIWIDPKRRRRGFATATLRALEQEARKLGAERTGLSVRTDEPDALALYSKLRYSTEAMQMTRLLDQIPPRSSGPDVCEETPVRSMTGPR